MYPHLDKLNTLGWEVMLKEMVTARAEVRREEYYSILRNQSDPRIKGRRNDPGRKKVARLSRVTKTPY